MELASLSESAAKGIPVTIMYHRVTRQVLFLEAGKDFVDLVMGFLTLPVGSIIKLLSESALVTPKTVGSIFNVFESISRLEAEEKMCADKKLLIDPKPAHGLRSKYLDAENHHEVEVCNESDNGSDPAAPQFYYTCAAIPHCSFVSVRSGTKCPQHQRKMTTQCQLIDGILSHTDSISSMSYELLKSLERGKRMEASLVDPRHRERRLYSTLREIDYAYQARLALCIEERELRISSVLSGALRDLDSHSSSTTTSDTSCPAMRTLTLGLHGRRRKDQRIRGGTAGSTGLSTELRRRPRRSPLLRLPLIARRL